MGNQFGDTLKYTRRASHVGWSHISADLGSILSEAEHRRRVKQVEVPVRKSANMLCSHAGEDGLQPAAGLTDERKMGMLLRVPYEGSLLLLLRNVQQAKLWKVGRQRRRATNHGGQRWANRHS